MPNSKLNTQIVTRILKVVINVGIKEGAKDEAILTKQQEELAKITGQKPKICRAKKSIAGFKLVKGAPIGIMVTLRKKRMNDFLTKLFSIVLPRVRDFRGLSPESFDGHGNYTIGIKEQNVFPESEFVKSEKTKGLEITVVTNAKSDQGVQGLLESLGAPFANIKKEELGSQVNNKRDLS